MWVTEADRFVVAMEPGNAGRAKGSGSSGLARRSTARAREEPVSGSKPEGKSFVVSKRLVWGVS